MEWWRRQHIIQLFLSKHTLPRKAGKCLRWTEETQPPLRPRLFMQMTTKSTKMTKRYATVYCSIYTPTSPQRAIPHLFVLELHDDEGREMGIVRGQAGVHDWPFRPSPPALPRWGRGELFHGNSTGRRSPSFLSPGVDFGARVRSEAPRQHR